MTVLGVDAVVWSNGALIADAVPNNFASLGGDAGVFGPSRWRVTMASTGPRFSHNKDTIWSGDHVRDAKLWHFSWVLPLSL